MSEALPIVLLLGFGILSWWLWRRRPLSVWVIRMIAAVAGAVLLYDAMTEPARRYPSLFFVFLCLLLAWRASDLFRHRVS